MDIGYIVTVLGVVLVSMTLHEAMHGFMAYWLGDDTAKLQGRLTLNPIKHIDPFLTIMLPLFLAAVGAPVFGGAKPVPFNPARVKYDEWGSALVALAGPLTNFMLAFIGFVFFVILGIDQSSTLGTTLSIFVYVNLGFFVFNMIPIPPLDGSRVMYALAPDFIRRGMETIEQFGVMFVFVVVMLASSVIGQVISVSVTGIITLFSRLLGVA